MTKRIHYIGLRYESKTYDFNITPLRRLTVYIKSTIIRRLFGNCIRLNCFTALVDFRA